MARMLGFGQPVGQIVQMAYVVEDIQAAIDWWVIEAKVGPWFLNDSFLGPGHLYRGTQTNADIALAMSFAGSMNIELIQPKDANPSVYKEIIDRRGFGFHHVGIAVEDLEAARREYEARGFQVAFTAPVGSGAVYYMDDGRNEPGFIELFEANAAMDQAFTNWWRQTVDWDGDNPVRAF